MRAVQAAVVLLALAPAAHAASVFKRPDCSAYQGGFKPESRCLRDVRKQWREANFAALQKTGLMFVYMARPDAGSSPAARDAVENKVEGSFALRFSVATDGSVYNVTTTDVTAGIEPLAALWAETIGRWQFAKVEQPVTDVEFRRIYLYTAEDGPETTGKPAAAQ